MAEFIREFSGYAIEWNRYGCEGGSAKGWRDEWFCFTRDSFEDSIKRSYEITLGQDLTRGGVVFARRSDDTLTFTTDDVGLIAHVKLVDNPANQLLVWKIDNHQVRGWSHRWMRTSNPRVRFEGATKFRDETAADLLEVAVVVAKQPRMTKSTPIFLSGGPPGTEAESAAARYAANPNLKRIPVWPAN